MQSSNPTSSLLTSVTSSREFSSRSLIHPGEGNVIDVNFDLHGQGQYPDEPKRLFKLRQTRLENLKNEIAKQEKTNPAVAKALQKEYDSIAKYQRLCLKWRFAFGQDPKGNSRLPSSLGGRFTPANKHFQETIGHNHLGDSYNASHPEHPIANRGGGSIGGVGNEVGMIEGLFEKAIDLERDLHYFFIPSADGKMPFSNQELQQILRELVVGIYLYETVPFFSLHFNKEGQLYPVIHPIYQNTLVGKVISWLDYYMKGFLNGAFFNEDFVWQWQQRKTNDKDFLKGKCIDLHGYCQQHLGSKTLYLSVREIIQSFTKLNPSNLSLLENPLFAKYKYFSNDKDPDVFSNYSGFRSSFRIIAKQNQIKKWENLFSLDGGFDVSYTIEPDPAYADELKKYRTQYGHDPQGYTQLVMAYEMMAEQIKTVMPSLPKFRELFEQLNVINFFCYYLKTLKQAQKIPLFDNKAISPSKGCPPLFPSLPIRRMQFTKVEMHIGKIFKKLTKEQQEKIRHYFKNSKGKMDDPPEEILKMIFPHFRAELQTQVPFPLSQDELSIQGHYKLISDFLKELPERAQKTLERLRSQDEMLNKAEITLICSGVQLRMSKTEMKWDLRDYDDPQYDFKDSYTQINNALTEVKNRLAFEKEALTEIWNLQRMIKTGELDLIEIAASHLSDLKYPFIEIVASHLSDLKYTFNESRSEIRFFSEQSEEEREENKTIVGGCGVHLGNLPVAFDPLGETILDQALPSLIQAEDEQMQPVTLNGSQKPNGYIFKVHITDYPAAERKEYTWMSGLLTQEEEKNRLRKESLFSSLLENRQEEFESLLTSREEANLKNDEGISLVHYAAAKKNIFYLKILMAKGANLTTSDPHGFIPLHYAAEKGRIEHLRLLLGQYPTTLNQQANQGGTPLYVAVQHGRKEAAIFLIQAGAHVNLATTHGMTPLLCAIYQGHEEIALNLLRVPWIDVNASLEDKITPLHWAVEFQMPAVVSTLIQEGARTSVKRKDTYTPLHLAAQQGNLEICQILLEAPDISINETLKSGRTAIQLAAESGHPKIVKLLLEHQASCSSSGWDEESVLMKAIYHENLEAAEVNNLEMGVLGCMAGSGNKESLQISETTPVFKQDSQQINAIKMAAMKDSVLMLKTLFSLDPFVDKSLGMDGFTALHYAALSGSFRSTCYLFERGADPLKSNSEGKTPLDCAVEHRRLAIIRYFVLYGEEVNLNELSTKGKLYLHWACEKGERELAALLIELGADIDIIDQLGNRPLDIAIKRGDCLLVHLLLALGSDPDKIQKEPQHPQIQSLLIQYREARQQIFSTKGTYVHLAVYLNDGEHLPLVLHKESVNGQDLFGATPLHLAISLKKKAMIQKLIDAGASLGIKDNQGRSILSLVIRAKNPELELVKILLAAADPEVLKKEGPLFLKEIEQKGLTSDFRALFNLILNYIPRRPITGISKEMGVAIAKGNREAILDEIYQGHPLQNKHFSLLLACIQDQQLALVKFFVEWFEGIDLNYQDLQGMTPLHVATLQGNVPLVQLLMGYGALREIKNKKDELPLHIAIFRIGSLEIVDLLLDNKKNYALEKCQGQLLISELTQTILWNQLISVGETAPDYFHQVFDRIVKTIPQNAITVPTDRMFSIMRLKNVEEFFQEVAEGHPIENQHFSLFPVAAEYEFPTILQYLVNWFKIKDVNRLDGTGRSALHWAVIKGDRSMVVQLKNYRVGLEVLDKEGRTPLYLACVNGQSRMAGFLIKKGASIKVKDRQGISLLEAITQMTQIETARQMFDVIYRSLPAQKMVSPSQEMVLAIKKQDQRDFFMLINQGHPVQNAHFSLLEIVAAHGSLSLWKILLEWMVKEEQVDEEKILKVAQAPDIRGWITSKRSRRLSEANRQLKEIDQGGGKIAEKIKKSKEVIKKLRKEPAAALYKELESIKGTYQTIREEIKRYQTQLEMSQGDRQKISKILPQIRDLKTRMRSLGKQLFNFILKLRKILKDQSNCVVQ